MDYFTCVASKDALGLEAQKSKVTNCIITSLSYLLKWQYNEGVWKFSPHLS